MQLLLLLLKTVLPKRICLPTAFVDENGNISGEEPSVFPNIALKYIRCANLYKHKESKYSHDYKYVGEWRKINRI